MIAAPARRWGRIAITAIASLIGVALLAGTALAYMRTNVSGSKDGSGSANTLAPMTVTINSTSVAKLYPGGPNGNVTFNVKNNTSQALALTAIESITGTGPGGCNPDISAVQPSTGLPVTVPTGATGLTLTLSGVVKMGTAATSNCQGQTITITMKLTGKY